MPALKPQAGVAYYRITWADPALTVPGVQPFFYVGSNLSDEDDSAATLHYFQDSLSYSWCGSLAEPEKMRKRDDMEPYVVTCKDSELDGSWVTLDGRIDELTQARARATAAQGRSGKAF